MLKSTQDARELLVSLNAPDRLLRHLDLVGESGEIIIAKMEELAVPIDKNFIRIGIAVHDAGKILHREELNDSGSRHEEAGEKLLIQHGVQKEIARCCRSHANYMNMEVSFGELLIALADKLWKGKREPDLELLVVDKTAALLNLERWGLFANLDTCFEEIASLGADRLSRSKP